MLQLTQCPVAATCPGKKKHWPSTQPSGPGEKKTVQKDTNLWVKAY